MIKIALLDDSAQVCADFVAQFDGQIYAAKCVFVANTSAQFVELLQQNDQFHFDFFLIDIRLENESGLNLVAKLYQRRPEVGIVMFSAVEDSEALIKAFASGAIGFLLKTHSLLEIVEYLQIAQNGGAAMSPTMARKLVNYFRPRDFERGKMGPRTVQVLHFLAEGWSYKLIADNMGITIDGVRFHIKEIYRTLNVQSKAQAVRKYLDGDY